MDTASFVVAAHSAREVRVVVQGADGEVRTPIWIVTVGPSVFIRSYRADKGKWYQHVLAKKTFPLEIEGEDVTVRAEPVTAPTVLEEVSAAYLAKYPNDSETPAMVQAPVVTTTLQLVSS